MRWSNRPGSIRIECYRDESGTPWACMSGPDRQLPDEMTTYLMPFDEFQVSGVDEQILELEFISSGFDYPGTYETPPDYCDDRDVVRATVNGKALPDSLRDNLAGIFGEQIDEVEIDR